MTPPPPPSPPPPSPPPPSPPPPTPTPPMPMTPPCLTDPEKEWPCMKNCHLTDPDQTTTCKDKCTPCVPPSSPPSPCLPPPELWECISICHLIDNDQTTTCKDKCTPCPEPPSAPPAPSCTDQDPPFCEDELKTDKDMLKKCKDQEFTTKCKESCGYCPSPVLSAASVVTTVTASGSVSDYPEDRQAEIKTAWQNFANAANVDVAVVDIDVQSSSTIIIITTAVANEEAALALRTKLSASLGTSRQATDVLGLDVTEDPTFDIKDSAVNTRPQSLKTTETNNGDSTVMLIGGGVAAIALLALLLFASRPSTRAFVRKAFGSAGGVQSTPAGQNSPTTASTSAANASSSAKGVLLDSSARQRSGLSWFRPARVQLLAAPEQDGESEASAWSALVLNGVTVPYEEVAGVRVNESTLEFIIKLKPRSSTPLPYTHVRLFTRAEFNLWREALNAEISNPTLHAKTEDKPSAVHAAQKWLASAEVAA